MTTPALTISSLHRILEPLTRLEGRHFGGRDRHLLAGLRIAPGTGRPFASLEGPEAEEGELVSLGQASLAKAGRRPPAWAAY